MKVYFVNIHYDNGEDYECHYEFDCVEKIFSTREKALAYIDSLKPEDIDDDDDIRFEWANGYPDPYPPKDTIRSFCRKEYDNVYETYVYSISEREVEE